MQSFCRTSESRQIKSSLSSVAELHDAIRKPCSDDWTARWSLSLEYFTPQAPPIWRAQQGHQLRTDVRVSHVRRGMA